MGGTNYTISGTSQLMSVPFALYAASSGNLATTGANVGDMQYWNGTTWVNISIGQPGQVLRINTSNIPEWSVATFPVVTTTPVAPLITDNFTTAVSGVTIISNGINNSSQNLGIVDRGICWSTSPNPTIINFKSVSATSIGGNILFQGGAAITQRGLCRSLSPNPTIADNKSELGIGDVSFNSLIAAATNTTYYVRAYATNSVGKAYGNEVTFTSSPMFAVGNYFQGGIVAYILQSGDPGYIVGETHGLITTMADYPGAAWGCSGMPNNLTQSAIGTGNQNTINIITNCATPGLAASVCADLNLNGYDDWYLPSSNELVKIVNNRNLIGGFTLGHY